MLPHTIEKKEMKSLNNFTEEKAAFLEAIEQLEHRFSDTLSFLDTWFEYSPSHFDNNGLLNTDSENHGSAKIFAFAKHYTLTKQQALKCFGEHFRNLDSYPSDSHLNIRQLMKFDLDGIHFTHFPLTQKKGSN